MAKLTPKNQQADSNDLLAKDEVKVENGIKDTDNTVFEPETAVESTEVSKDEPKKEETDNASVVVEPPVTESPKAKKNTVTVKTVRDHSCVIGGVQYMFEAGQRTPVPENVRCVLSRAGLLRG